MVTEIWTAVMKHNELPKWLKSLEFKISKLPFCSSNTKITMRIE